MEVHAQVNIITTICGNDTAGYSGDNGPAEKAKLYKPESLCIDLYDNIYVADLGNNRVRKIALSTGVITTIAGTGVVGFAGDNGFAIDANLFAPESVSVDADGNIYIADAGNNRIRKITASTGIITTIAGSGPTGVGTGSDVGDGGLATNAQLNKVTIYHLGQEVR